MGATPLRAPGSGSEGSCHYLPFSLSKRGNYLHVFYGILKFSIHGLYGTSTILFCENCPLHPLASAIHSSSDATLGRASGLWSEGNFLYLPFALRNKDNPVQGGFEYILSLPIHGPACISTILFFRSRQSRPLASAVHSSSDATRGRASGLRSEGSCPRLLVTRRNKDIHFPCFCCL